MECLYLKLDTYADAIHSTTVGESARFDDRVIIQVFTIITSRLFKNTNQKKKKGLSFTYTMRVRGDKQIQAKERDKIMHN